MVWNGKTIPAGTTFFMVSPFSPYPIGLFSNLLKPPENAWAADYDEDDFKQAYQFIPKLYLDLREGSGIPHSGYGAGSRICAGSHLASCELFTAFVRLITTFEVTTTSQCEDFPIFVLLKSQISLYCTLFLDGLITIISSCSSGKLCGTHT